MKLVCHTDSVNPAQSLVKSIYYPEEFAFTSNSTCWGLSQENIARELYLKHTAPNHDCLVVSNSGLEVNPQWPFIGASPDGMVVVGMVFWKSSALTPTMARPFYQL